MKTVCPFCGDRAVRTFGSQTLYRCGTEGPDESDEYKTGHVCDIRTYARLMETMRSRCTRIEAARDAWAKACRYLRDIVTSKPRGVASKRALNHIARLIAEAEAADADAVEDRAARLIGNPAEEGELAGR